eukprot:s3959_g2.t1
MIVPSYLHLPAETCDDFHRQVRNALCSACGSTLKGLELPASSRRAGGSCQHSLWPIPLLGGCNSKDPNSDLKQQTIRFLTSVVGTTIGATAPAFCRNCFQMS